MTFNTNRTHMNRQIAHENERMRSALRTIADMAERSTSALTMPDIARIARAALVTSPRENTSLRAPDAAVAMVSKRLEE